MKIKQKDIAEATGYSVNTVSHALRNEPDISEPTKKIIREAAKRLDYIPNIQASSIKSGKSRIVSIILPDIINPHFTIVFREIEQYFRKLGITPFFMNTNEDAEAEWNTVRISVGQNADGVILCPTQVDTGSVSLLQKSHIPFVLIGRYFPELPDTDYVVCDDTEGAYLATRHLISHGHRSIAAVRVNDRISSDRERFAGYRKALDEAGIPFRESMLLNLSLNAAENGTAIRDYLRKTPDCTAVLSFNDILAYQIIYEIRKAGLRVPEDISVIGFDNICSDYIFPTQLSSVSVSKKNMALLASETLYHYISGQVDSNTPERRHIVLPTRLFLRDTTSDVRAADVPEPRV